MAQPASANRMASANTPTGIDALIRQLGGSAAANDDIYNPGATNKDSKVDEFPKELVEGLAKAWREGKIKSLLKQHGFLKLAENDALVKELVGIKTEDDVRSKLRIAIGQKDTDIKALAQEDPNYKARQIIEKTIPAGSVFSGLIKDLSPSSDSSPMDLTGIPKHSSGGTISIKPNVRKGEIKKIDGGITIEVPFKSGQITNHLLIERVPNMAEPMYRIFLGDNVQNRDINAGTNILYVSPYFANQVIFKVKKDDGKEESISLAQIPEQGSTQDVKIAQDIENHRYGPEIWNVNERLFKPEDYASLLGVPLTELQETFFKNLQSSQNNVTLGKTKSKDLTVWKDTPLIRSSDLFSDSQGAYYNVQAIGDFDPAAIQALKEGMIGPYKVDLSKKLDATAKKGSKEKYIFLSLKATEKAVSVPTYEITEDLAMKINWGDGSRRFLIPKGTLLTRLQAERLLAITHGDYEKEGMPKEISLHKTSSKVSSKQGETSETVSEGAKVLLDKVLAPKTTYMIFENTPQNPDRTDFRGALTVATPESSPSVKTILLSDRDNGLHRSNHQLQGIDAHPDPVLDDTRKEAKLNPARVDPDSFNALIDALIEDPNIRSKVDVRVHSASEFNGKTPDSENKNSGILVSVRSSLKSLWDSIRNLFK